MSDPDATQPINPAPSKSAAPTRKVTAGALAGSLSSVVMWVLSTNGITAPAGIESQISVIFAFLVAYIVPEKE